ncbi:bifunctional oligoribonuclease/PAP phosphatase NrnA [Desulfurispirillum indicum]|uniref:Phosphoesterase RecJ domain protein n=1 Tax=Desulfurispirillum indicum (strain ATCC BAA-1389 / DSM 22839 / S5) TaxID=653733 RepID=E6W0E0_DESIS|nr:bifunctional oligoribonuclease/PAP phosphatase NrnA [Desulfurispirillum indicum]ADU66358.1 phosphoesterase RecJ domain protein [Desulfurispirillum indicum S5]UCZ55692.1 bifunctional oligoribonuclease/PAP phosphatase NrnA [Desulfurispirillum indicum]
MSVTLFDDREEILSLMSSCQRPGIFSHVNPDGDTIGCALALYHRFTAMGKDPVVLCESSIPREYAFLPGARNYRKQIPADVDALFIVDTSTVDRFGNFELPPGVPTVNIDHHITNRGYADYNYVIGEAPATATLIYELLEKLGPLVFDEALCLYTALFTDTGGFRYASSNVQSHLIAAKLLAKGIDPWQVTVEIYESMTWEKVQLYKRCLDRVVFDRKKAIAWSYLTLSDLQETGTVASDTDGFINSLRAIDGVEVAVFVRQDTADSFKVSFRSKGNIDVSAISEAFGGGGHRNAGGFQIQCTDVNRVMEQICEKL